MAEKNKILLCYCPFPKKSSLKKIISFLIKKKLIFCANVLNSSSYYFWDGKINSDKELLVFFKTMSSKKTKLISELKKLHPYKIPCILFFKASDHLKAYEKWAKEVLK